MIFLFVLKINLCTHNITPIFFHALTSIFVVLPYTVFDCDRIPRSHDIKQRFMSFKIFSRGKLLTPLFVKKKFG